MPTLRETTINGYLAIADLHGKKNNPRYRVDEYKLSFIKKLEWCVSYANEHNLRILIAGDIFDSVREGLEILNLVVGVLIKATHIPVAVCGQHDLQFHSKNMLETPIFNLALTGIIKLASDVPITDGYYVILGAGWGDKTPFLPDKMLKSILITHRCITPDKPPFFLPDAISAAEAVSEFKDFRYIISGDYHESFTHKADGTTLINCGPMMRNSKSLYDHKPCVWTIVDDVVEQVNIPVQAPELVFDVESIEFDETHGMTLDLSRMKELMGMEYVVKDFKDVVWAGYNLSKDHKDCLIKEVSVQKALRLETIWEV